MIFTLTRGACMPADRITPTPSHADTIDQVLGAARTARATLRRLSLEGWLALACVFVVMWAVGWL
jgi:CHASE2 domain-containing sensor protein